MKIETAIDLPDGGQVEVTAEASWVEAEGYESSFGHWDIEDVRFKETGADVPDKLITQALKDVLAEIAAEEAFAREEAGRDARDDLRKEKTPW